MGFIFLQALNQKRFIIWRHSGIHFGIVQNVPQNALKTFSLPVEHYISKYLASNGQSKFLFFEFICSDDIQSILLAFELGNALDVRTLFQHASELKRIET